MNSVRATVESNPELFRVEEWSPPKGTGTAGWVAIAAGGFLGSFFSGFSDLPIGVEFFFVAVFMVCAFAALALQILVLRRGGASTRLRWSDSNILRVFGPIEIEEDSKVERGHFAAAGIIPPVLFLLLLAGSFMAGPEEASGFALATLLGAALGGSIKELVYSALTLKRPRGTLVEELGGGAVRFYKPTFPRL